MGLHHMADDGTIHWHCPNPDCKYHNCKGWHRDIQCIHHKHPTQKSYGETKTVHLSHEQVQWTASDLVALPRCECGTQTTIKTKFSDKDLAPPVVTYNEDGSIQSVEVVGAPNFTILEHRLQKHILPHPDQPDQYMEAFSLTILDVRQHPMIAHHQKLHRLLHEHGKRAPQQAR